MGIGEDLAAGFALGIENGIDAAVTAAQSLAWQAAKAAQGVMEINPLGFDGKTPATYVSTYGRPPVTPAPSTPATPPVGAGIGGALIGSLTIVETQNPRNTARTVINELRTESLLIGAR